MKFSGQYLYRVRVTRYPEGAFVAVDPDGEVLEPTPGWRPPGWRPRGEYTRIMGTEEFVWPVTNQVYGSQSTAKQRQSLIQSFGATAIVERSSKIAWPEEVDA